ncbi:hypothetical protein BJ085DRAFT_32852 [Dimargaris cristalligena]|uniref:3-oxo-5-alpha-steroid 4-dehydrogenase C-terminal domain-containing protein n=1 Tax=Dimargaris cristalligena TaxID=215637 RepID=A0A4Q0A2D6_9FUNG|nr:hypothetical protein BJ085DRAFT_32852 [Dimargaris cristalligena]|eukprot:RKP39502.1 hypothetical protein BJ085DRAFT_32852 [Dimargaris cristalligena]
MPPPPPTPIPTVALFHGLAYITYAYYTLVITTALALLPLLSVRQLLLHGKTRSDEAKPPARETHSVIHRFWSRFQRCTVPKHWFAHFYLVGAVWNASLICIILKYFALSSNAANIDDGSPMYYVSGLAKWLSAEFQWTFTVAPPPPPGHYLLGLSFYIVTVPTLLLDTLRLTLWDATSYHQSRCHYILAQLRTPSEPVAPTAPKEVRKGKRPQFPQSALTETHGKSSVDANKGRSTSAVYRIPAGDWFTGIECPHYYAEILIYLSLTFMAVPWLATTVEPATENFTQLAASPSTSVMTLSPAAAMPEHLVSYLWRLTTPKPGLGLLLLNTWNLVNLGISAWSTHVWYQRKFKSEFPTGRWILIPYVF